ncbi:MAG: cation-translocating P-type ATPase [Deltaproteobacteria bacterium]|nr:cation-translocating P-type ATPase [Deltaproteobacteria bacterium]
MSASSRPEAARSPSDAAVHAEPLDALLDRLGASSAEGLTAIEARARLERQGPNALPEQPGDPAWKRLLSQFLNPIVLTLLAAAAIAVFVGAREATGSFLSRFADAIAILLIVVINALIGFYQERRAEAALDALRELAAPNARVRRDGAVLECPASEVVPGDLVELEAGDAIPADARLVQTFGFATEESALTGEAVPRVKDALATIERDAPLAERDTMVFTGTTVVRGRGRAVVTQTGVDTELGRIGKMIAEIGDQKTPLEERLDAFGQVILWGCIALSTALLAWGLLRPKLFGGEPRAWPVLLLEAVALAVAAIPEGLPAITTITLALGMQRMARRGAIVRKLPAVETLGAATVICSDKTGTLTQNEMTVRAVYTVGRSFRVTGQGYEPAGEIRDEQGKVASGGAVPEALEQLLATASLCNNAELRLIEGCFRVVGDPTEGALLALAEKGGVPPASVRATSVVVTELPFDSDRKRMTIVARDERGLEIAHVKGSVDVLLPRCEHCATDDGPVTLDDARRTAILEAAQAMSRDALRVLAICRRERHSGAGASNDVEHLERELTFLGLVGMMDPPRVGVAEAIATCLAAGIRPVMITGDDKTTARAIAEEIGMWQPGDEALTGTELEAMSEAELDRHAPRLKVFARTTPEQKLRIVRAFKRAGHVVAMTGDGVNDAPALREANIGVAMGKMGTDVARQAADLVLADDNFATIVDAVREGRAIYRNIQKFIFFLLSANMGLVVAVFTVSFFGEWPPLTPLMVLWINLVTNGLPALALGIDPPDQRLMEEPPRDPTERLMVFRDYLGMLFVGTVMGGAAVATYALAPQDPQSLEAARALAFTLLAVSPLIHAWSCRSPIRSVLQCRPRMSWPLFFAVLFSLGIHLVAVLVPSLQPVFRTFSVSPSEWVFVLGLAAIVLPAVELAKLFNRLWFRGRDEVPRSLARED